MTKRIEWIDIAKGIGIFLVIVGHTGLPEVFRAWIYSFHMPMFFLISGFLFKVTKSNRIITKLYKSLILPYFLYSIAFIFIDYLLFKNYYEVKIGLINTFTGKGSFSVLWFFVSLFWIQLFFNYTFSKFNENKSLIIIGVVTLIGYSITLTSFSDFNPYYLLTSSVSISFFAIGYMIKLKNVNLNNYFNNRALFIIFCFLNIISFYLNYKMFNRRIDLSDAYFGFILFTYISSLTGTYIVMKVSYMISSYKCMKPIKYIGKNTLWYFPLSAYIPKRIVNFLEANYYVNVSFKNKLIIILMSLIIIAIIIEVLKNKKIKLIFKSAKVEN